MSEKELEEFLYRSFNDPIAGILLKNSNLTKIQYESLLIDYLTDNISDIGLTYENKALYRSKKVSRGSFSRTLSQARKNIISSIYTILLMAYLGIYDSNSFDDYRNLSDKMSDYTSLLTDFDLDRKSQMIRRLELELYEGIKSLSEPKRLKNLWYHTISQYN